MARTQASLVFLASLVMPADVERRGVLIDAKGWRVDLAGVPPDADVIAWGAWPAPGERSLASSLRSALTREVALRTVRLRLPDGFVQTGVHRLPPLVLRPGTIRGRVHAFLSGGALIEVQRSPGVGRVIDELLEAAGARAQTGSIRPGAGASAWVRASGRNCAAMLVRFGASGDGSDPHVAADGLERLEAAGIGLVPRLLSRGVRDRVSWSAESVLAGATPSRLTPALAQATGRFLATLPASDRTPSAHRRDLVAIGGAFPSRSHEIDALTRRVDQRLHSLPAVVRHGDLWSGNLLVEGGSLTGVIDWDAWHSEGVPGCDLMYLGVMDRARRTGRSSGRVWSDRPWRLPILRQAFTGYWSRLSLAPGEDVLEAAAVAGWAAQVASTLHRTPDLASTPRWFLRNVEPMLALAR